MQKKYLFLCTFVFVCTCVCAGAAKDLKKVLGSLELRCKWLWATWCGTGSWPLVPCKSSTHSNCYALSSLLKIFLRYIFERILLFNSRWQLGLFFFFFSTLKILYQCLPVAVESKQKFFVCFFFLNVLLKNNSHELLLNVIFWGGVLQAH